MSVSNSSTTVDASFALRYLELLCAGNHPRGNPKHEWTVEFKNGVKINCEHNIAMKYRRRISGNNPVISVKNRNGESL